MGNHFANRFSSSSRNTHHHDTANNNNTSSTSSPSSSSHYRNRFRMISESNGGTENLSSRNAADFLKLRKRSNSTNTYRKNNNNKQPSTTTTPSTPSNQEKNGTTLLNNPRVIVEEPSGNTQSPVATTSSQSVGVLPYHGHHRKTTSQPPPLSLIMNTSSSPHSYQNHNYLLYNYTLASSAPASPILNNYSLSPISNNGGIMSTTSSPSNRDSNFISSSAFSNTGYDTHSSLNGSSAGDTNGQSLTTMFTPQQRVVHEKLRQTFPSMKNVPDYFLSYFSIVLSDEVTLRETIFSSGNDISFYLEMQSKIEELFLNEEDEKNYGKSPIGGSHSQNLVSTPSSSYTKSPIMHNSHQQSSFDSANWGMQMTEDGDVSYSNNYSMGYLTNSEDFNENITSNMGDIGLGNNEVSSSIINYQRDFLNPFHIMDRTELPIRFLILPRILKNAFYAKHEVAQMVSPIFSNRNSLHFRDAFIQSNEFVIFAVVGFWILEFLPSSSIIIPKLIYASSELFSNIQSIPVVATINNSDGSAMNAVANTIIRWNTGKKNPDLSYMHFIDDLLESLSVNFKWKHNFTFTNFRNHIYNLEWQIPSHYNLLKVPTLTNSSQIRMKSLEDFEAVIPKLMLTVSNEMIISKGACDYLSCIQKSFSEDYFTLSTIRAALLLKEFVI
ncbi:hypothetical protein C9374_005228 [Naegleria lovaniensis]|uniref:Uncharacterized protein n=1 Tax=Naegleria lovaniensis TaxID=51637 RepID=A0AA88GR59_NAELO|nr:uncharacterized protein C9374_005228 [Naegleria lovaniensis]KAG2382648.1 hypothetical protein C9374_005228 [Naegleria lovaniensis]